MNENTDNHNTKTRPNTAKPITNDETSQETANPTANLNFIAKSDGWQTIQKRADEYPAAAVLGVCLVRKDLWMLHSVATR